jgi:membrane protease YdiL (CAAX protease family)
VTDPDPSPPLKCDTPTEPVSVVSPLTDREIWWELLAVLAIGVLPQFYDSMWWLLMPPAKLPYWVNALEPTLRSMGVSVAVLYVLYRSGEPWTNFGVTRPRVADYLLGVCVFIAHLLLYRNFTGHLHSGTFKFADYSSPPDKAVDYVLMTVQCATTGFAHELVFRAYLVTRLQHVLRSPSLAVVVSALSFGPCCVHFGRWGWLDPTIAGLLYGGLFLGVRRLWPFAVARVLFNLVAALSPAT